MTVTDLNERTPRRTRKVDAGAFQSMLASSSIDPSKAVNPFKIEALHPPVVGHKGGLVQDESLSLFGNDISEWAWHSIEAAMGSTLLHAMRFIGFPALANLSQKAEYRRMVEIIATEMTRKWIKITVASEDDKTDKVKKIEAEMLRLGVRDLFRKVAEHDGYFGRGHIYIDTGADTNDSVELATPIGSGSDDISRAKVGRGRFNALRIVEPVWCSPALYNATDPLAPDYYVPTQWYVQNKRIHASRLLTFISRPVSDLLKPSYSFGGIPLTQLAETYVNNWDRIRESVGRLVQSFSTTGFKTKMAEALNSGISADDMIRRLQLFTNFKQNQGTFVLDVDEEFFNVTTPLSGLDELQAQSQEHMSAVTGIPLVKFFGLSPHGLNASSEGEIRVFYDWIHAVQEVFFRPQLTTIINFTQLSLFGDIDPDIGFDFEPLWTQSAMEDAQVRQADASTDKTYIDANVLSPLEVRKKVASDKGMPYAGLDLDDEPEMTDEQLSENATKMATPILTAYTDGLIDASQALGELVEAGLFKTITEEDVANAKANQEVPEPPGPDGEDPSSTSGPAAGGGGGGGTASSPVRAPPNLRLASARDEAPPFDLGKLTKIESERLRRALRENDIETVREILEEREAHCGAWDADPAEGFVAYHGSPFDFDHFDSSHIGTGTARAHYGTGIYLATSPVVARRYLDELTDRLQLSGKPIHRLNAAQTHITGHLYTVRVMRPRTDFVPWTKAQDAKWTDEELRRRGLAGYVYRDPQLRGELNYVVFDPKDIKVLKQDDKVIAEDRLSPSEQRAPKGSHQGGQFTSGHWDPAEGKKPPSGPESQPEANPDDERISTRVPTAKPKKGQTAVDPHRSADFQVGLESSKASKAAFEKNAELIKKIPGLGATKNMKADEASEYFVNHVKSNVLALWDSVPDEIKGRSKLWYDGAHKMAEDWAQHFGIEPRVAAGVIAALSPQNDWFQNISLAHRVIDTIKNHSDKKTTQRMKEWAEAYAQKLEEKTPEVAAGVRKMMQGFEGKTLADIQKPLERAHWIRFWDETENTRSFPEMSPEGAVLGSVKNKDGRDSRAAWKSFREIAKAVSIVDDPSPENISKNLGGNHKVRNFYNNIIAPQSKRGDVTIDTHAIGAAALMPWSGADPEVKDGLGLTGAKDAATGSKGLYGLYAEGYRRAAQERGVLPREMQSVTWEAQRGLFKAEDKGDDLRKEIKGHWDDADSGKITRDEAQRRILSRGISPPSWHRPSGGVHGDVRHTADAHELHRGELGRPGLSADGGGRGGIAGTVPLALDLFQQWNEQQHPREQHGRFTSGPGVARKVAQAPALHHPHVEYQPTDPRERQPAQLSWESAPGKTTRNMPQFHDAPLEQRREYQQAIEKVLSDEKGHDVIAQTLGLRTGPTFASAGVFQGRVNPGAQTQVNLGRLGDDDKAKINASEAIRGILLRQDAAAWHRPEPPPSHAYLIPGLKTAKGVVFPTDTGHGVTHKDALAALGPEEQKAFLASGAQNDANYVFKNDKGQVLSRTAARQYAEQNGLLSDIGRGYKQPKLISEHLDPHASTRFVDIDPKDSNMLDFRMGRSPSEAEAAAIDQALGAVSGLEYALVPTQQGWRVLNTGSMPNDQFGAAVHSAIEGLESDSLPEQIEAQRAHYVGDYLANDWSKSPHAEDYLQAIRSAGPDVERSADTLLANLGPKIAAVEDQFAQKYGWTPDVSSRVWEKGPAQDLLARNGGAPHPGQIDDAAKRINGKYGTTDQIAKIREMMKQAVPTNAHVNDGGHTLDDGTYTPERAQLHKEILRKLFTPEAVQGATPAPGQRPTMTVLGGRGGSGKSFITGADGPVSRKNTIVVDSDAFKQQLPEYEGWNAGLVHEESSHIADMAAQIAKQKGLNVAFDQTMKSGTSALRRIDQFQDTHDVHGIYMHSTPEIAADRAMGRFAKGGVSDKGTGRFVPPEYILGSYGNEKNFDDIIPRLKRWTLYDNNGERGSPKKVAEGRNDRHF